MQWNDTLQNLLLIGGGAVALELLRYFRDLTSGILKKKRSEVDRLAQELALAIAERDKQTILKLKYRDSNYALRGMMLKSGNWEQADLPDEPPE